MKNGEAQKAKFDSRLGHPLADHTRSAMVGLCLYFPVLPV
jgi:hypothetical protein